MDLPAFDKVADIYDATRALPEPIMTCVLDKMKQVLGDCATIVDVGVGTGRFAQPLQEMGFRVVGADVSRGMLAKASEKGVRELLLADVHHLPFEDGTFDAALVVHVLHLLKDWQSATSEIGRVSTRKVVSVVGRTDGPSIRAEYRRLRAHFGYPLDRFEGGEESLRELVRPVEVVKVGEYTSETAADDEVSYLAGRGSSTTWNLDEDVHSKVITELRKSYGGKVLRRKHLVELAVWRPDQLRL